MACTLINSVTAACELNSGGIKEIKIKVNPSLATIAAQYAVSSGVVTITGASLSGWKTYTVVKETAFFTDNQTMNIQNGTTQYAPHVKLIINKLRAAIRNEIEVFGYQVNLQFAVRDQNDNYWLLGKDEGLNLIASVIGTGTARTDRNGYELDFEGKESIPKLSLTSANYALLIDV